MVLNTSHSATNSTNKFLYQTKELNKMHGQSQDANQNYTKHLYWNDFHARQYDAQLGRFTTLDPMRQDHSGFMGMGNNPVSHIDPDGMQWGLVNSGNPARDENGDNIYTDINSRISLVYEQEWVQYFGMLDFMEALSAATSWGASTIFGFPGVGAGGGSSSGSALTEYEKMQFKRSRRIRDAQEATKRRQDHVAKYGHYNAAANAGQYGAPSGSPATPEQYARQVAHEMRGWITPRLGGRIELYEGAHNVMYNAYELYKLDVGTPALLDLRLYPARVFYNTLYYDGRDNSVTYGSGNIDVAVGAGGPFVFQAFNAHLLSVIHEYLHAFQWKGGNMGGTTDERKGLREFLATEFNLFPNSSFMRTLTPNWTVKLPNDISLSQKLLWGVYAAEKYKLMSISNQRKFLTNYNKIIGQWLVNFHLHYRVGLY